MCDPSLRALARNSAVLAYLGRLASALRGGQICQAIALCTLAACGRIGVELLPIDPSPPTPDARAGDAHVDHDAGMPCATGYADCDGEPMNGCEADLSSVDHCGACDVRCTNAHGTASCNAGVCALSCSQGYLDCDGDLTTGCEANVAADPARCGTCNVACDPLSQICVNGACQLSPCAPGLGECDGDPSVPCETDVRTSVAHCGFCNNPCAPPNATPQCIAGMCQAESCNAGWEDCDRDRSNGCETSLNTPSNCGGCGTICPPNGGTPICDAATCGTRCDLGGTFALKIELQTSWAQSQYIAAGSGVHVFWIKVQATHSGNSVAATLTECGRYVPDFRARSVNETFHFDLPDALFGQTPPHLPSSAATITLSSSGPGASLNLPATAFLMGTSMADPVNAAWPASASALTPVDMDSDGKAGVTLRYLNGGGYIHPRVGGTLFDDRAQSPYSATRLVFALGGTLNSCTQASGTATVTHIDTRIFGCEIAGGSGDCSAGEANFLDQNCVLYQLGSASYNLVKLAEGASCADVRAALP